MDLKLTYAEYWALYEVLLAVNSGGYEKLVKLPLTVKEQSVRKKFIVERQLTLNSIWEKMSILKDDY